MKKIWFYMAIWIFLGTALIGQSTTSRNAESSTPRIGVLLLAHGGRLQSWNEEVRHVADQVDLKIPTEVALGMATRSSIQAGIDRLIARGVTQIVAVSLFVSSHSSVIDSTAYLLGLRSDAPEDLKIFASMDHRSGMNHTATNHDSSQDAPNLQPIHLAVSVRMAPALDHHRIVADILGDRAASISQNPSGEVVILVAHGPVPDDENALWLKDMKLLADRIQSKKKYSAVEYLTLRDDADKPVRDAATEELRLRVEKINASGKTALIVPQLLSFGGIEDGLRERLKGLTYRMPSQGILPDKRIVDWVLSSAEEGPSGVMRGSLNF